MAEKAIVLPFSINSFGRVTDTTEMSKIWADRVRSVIGTALRERVMLPDFGTDIPSSVFETTEEADSQIQTEVIRAFNEQLSALTLDEVSSTFDEFTGVMNVDITYALPNDEVVNTSIGLVSIAGTAPVYEELQ
jgi:phage baseplate assembly protein W